MKIYSIFNIDRLKLYYKKTSEVEGNQLEVIKGVEK